MSTDQPTRPSLAPGSESYLNDPTHFGIHPGEEWPDDVPRDQDDTRWRYMDDPVGARRAELRIAACWIVTLLCGCGLATIYCLGGDSQIEGALLCVGFGFLGVGFILWARDLLPGHEVTASRGHHNQSSASARAAVVQSLGRGLEPIARRPFLGKVLGLVGGVFGLAVLFPLASLGPRPHRSLDTTPWGKDVRVLNEDGSPVKPSDVSPNGILTVFPETGPKVAQAAVILINLENYQGKVPAFEVPAQRRTWHVGSLVAYSKICTHAGCPVSLYNTEAHQLVCPCHQSTFDVLEDCKPVFGPAPRSLPQLPLAVDQDGYLVSQSDFDQPVGPGVLEPRMSTTAERRAAERRQEAEKAGLDFVDDRFGSSSFVQSAMDKIFPDHWSFMVGEIAMYCFVILLITGIYLALYYVPSSADVIYHGPYKPLDGQHMSEAYASVLRISFQVRAGLVMRQVHHWAAVVFLAAIGFHLCRIFFSGAFRRPREVNWTIGLLLLIISMLEGFSGYSLPDDLLSGTGLRVVFSIIESIPLIGTWVAFDLWGGAYPGTTLITRLFVVHEFLFPLAILGLLTVHLMILWRQKHTDFPGPGKTETNIHGSRLWPQYALKSAGLFMMVIAVLTMLGGLFQINPIWIYGPYTPYNVSAGSQPDWYVGWLDGSLRLWPHWEFRSWGHEIANPFFPGVLIPGLVFTVMFAWPFIDRKIYNDHEPHNLLNYPRERPFRTAVGCAALAFFTDLTFASATDLIGNDLHIGYERLIEILQYGAFIGPIAAGIVAYKVCVGLNRTGAHPIQRPVGGIIVRGVDGSYHTLGDTHHAPHGDGDHGADHDGAAHDGNGADAPVHAGAADGHEVVGTPAGASPAGDEE